MKRLISLARFSPSAWRSDRRRPFAGDAAAQPTAVKGWITDSFCGANNANAAGAPSAPRIATRRARSSSWSRTARRTRSRTRRRRSSTSGHEVVITGTLDKDTIKVEKIEAAKKDKA